MKITVFLRRECPHCEEVVIPENMNIETIYIDDESYEGHQPDGTPVIQIGKSLKAVGEPYVMGMLESLKLAQDGFYSK